MMPKIQLFHHKMLQIITLNLKIIEIYIKIEQFLEIVYILLIENIKIEKKTK